MKIKSRTLLRAAGSLLAGFLPVWMNSLDARLACYNPTGNPSFCHRPHLFIFWHEYLQWTVHLWKNCNIAMMLSRHGDADVLEELAHLFGYGTVRGSTNRQGSAAIQGMRERGKEMHLTMTPDGPRGPRRRLAPGCIYLASRLQMPMIALGIGFDRPWRLPTWDRFALPRPGSRARIISSDEIIIPPDLDRDGIEHYRGQVESLMNYLCDEADDWARSGYEIKNAGNIQSGPKSSFAWLGNRKFAEVEENEENIIRNYKEK